MSCSISEERSGRRVFIQCHSGGHPRPPLKIILFPVHRPGELISAEWIHFFHISKIIFFLSIVHIISIQRREKKKKKKILRPPDWPQLWPPGRQETNFFLRVALLYFDPRVFECFQLGKVVWVCCT